MAILLVAKPLLAFNMYNRVSSNPTKSNQFLLLRLVKKRKEGDYFEDMIAEVMTAGQNISLPVYKLLLRYASFIALFFASKLEGFIVDFRHQLKNTFFKITPASQYFLVIGKLSI